MDLKQLPKEGLEIEYKKAQSELPKSFWETYSSFGNTKGGIIVLGVSEDNGLEISGVRQPEKIVDDLWNMLSNPQKVSRNILTDKDVEIIEIDGKSVIIVRVPEADRRFKPIFVGGEIGRGTFVRYGQGDHHCDPSRLYEMIRDSEDVPRDDMPVEELSMDAFEKDTVRRYRDLFAEKNPGSPYNRIDDHFLTLIGAAGDIDGTKHPTKAGTLMFCNSLYTVKVFPQYFLDYRRFDDDGPDWVDRVTSMRPGRDDNLFDFFSSVLSKVWNSMPEPLVFDKNMLNRDDNPMRRAVRELITNAILHADYLGEQGVVIDYRPNRIVIANPGHFRIPVKVAMEGGRSSPRNPTLFRMFGLIGAVERAGTGVNRSIIEVESIGLEPPKIEQNYEPSRTIVTVGLVLSKTKDNNEERILDLMKKNGNITLDELADSINESRSSVYNMLKAMRDAGKIRREGSKKSGKWVVIDG